MIYMQYTEDQNSRRYLLPLDACLDNPGPLNSYFLRSQDVITQLHIITYSANLMMVKKNLRTKKTTR